MQLQSHLFEHILCPYVIQFYISQSSAYMLADIGYDVWLGNLRGNRYSRQHIKLNPDGGRKSRRQFWSFTWHEMGLIDLPAIIDYITEITGQNRMHYIGHSQGSTSFFVLMSERQEYNARIISMNALAPIAYLGNLRSPFVRSAAFFLNTVDVGNYFLYFLLINIKCFIILDGLQCVGNV